jgi:hypothetical protein
MKTTELTFKDMNTFFKDPPALTLNVSVNETARYRIDMKNDYLNSTGGVMKRQYLQSVYTRTIKEKVKDILYLTKIKMDEVRFESESKTMNWTFAEGTEIPHCLYYCHQDDEFLFISKQKSEGIMKQQLSELGETFAKFPKLPSVSLFMMQVLDILGFEDLAGHALSNHSILQHPGIFKNIGTLPDAQCNLVGGSFAQGSTFKNKSIHCVSHGLSAYRDRVCAVYEFFCEGARLEAADTQRSKKGTSTYFFILHIDIETGLLVKGFMNEFIYASTWTGGEHPKKIPSNARRRVSLELLD